MPQGPRLIAAMSIQTKSATAGIPSATELAVSSTGSFTGFSDEVANALITVNGNETVCSPSKTSTV
jgi:hypothetical protein